MARNKNKRCKMSSIQTQSKSRIASSNEIRTQGKRGRNELDTEYSFMSTRWSFLQNSKHNVPLVLPPHRRATSPCRVNEQQRAMIVIKR